MIKEVCIENGTRIPELIEKKVKRVELCDNLAVGGTTVSYGVAKKVIEQCHANGIEVMAIIRCRAGDFIYSDDEMDMMITDIEQFKKLGVDGVVFGSTTADLRLHKEQALAFIKASQGIKKTFHMAFDHLSDDDQKEAIDFLVSHGVDRILTHGSAKVSLIEENVSHLKEIIAYANNRIIILPGGGITTVNASHLMETLGIQEVHGTRVV